MSTNDVKLFSSIKYFTTGFHDSSLETTFKQNGATRSFYLTETTTHVICDDFDSYKSELEQAIEIYQTPIVNSSWIIACLKCNTLLPIDPFRNDDNHHTAHIFRSCTFTNANLTNEDHNRLYALVTYYGGRWTANLDDPNCTHIICASALVKNENETIDNQSNTNERLQLAYEIQSEKIHLITPDWIIDCLNASRLLEEMDYHPDLLRDPNEPMDIDEDELDDEQNNENLHNQSTDEHTPTKTTTTGTTHRSQLITKNFFNQSDQTTPPPSAEPVPGMNDGTNLPDSSDISQTKAFPPKRSRTRTTTTTPRQRNTKINSTANNSSHSNQNGHSSTIKDTNLSTLPIEEKLIRPSVLTNLLNSKTNLQTSRQPPPESLSYELNYCLQDKHELVPSTQCLLGCVIYIYTCEYISTVSKDNLSTWSKTILDHGALLTDDINHMNLTHFVCAYRTSELFRQVCKRGNIRMVTAHWLNDVLERKKLFVPNLAIHYPSPFEPNESEKLPLVKYFFTMTGFEGIERARLRYMIRSLGGKYSGHLSKWHTHLLARENGKTDKFKKAFEWSIPIVNGIWLSELYLGNTCALKQPIEERYKRLNSTPTIDHFSFDQIFVHDLLLPWSQPIRITDEMLNSSIRRHNEQQQHILSSSNIQDMDIDHDYLKNSYHYNEPINSLSELSLVNNINNESISIMLSGFNMKTLNHYETIIKSLGGKISTLPHTTTHLIMNRFLRTEKLYECMNYVTYILNKTWLDKCNEEKCFLSIEESDWIINEEFQLTTQNFFKQSINKRIYRENRLLFLDYTFFLTPSIQPSHIILKSIIHSSGGHVYQKFPTIKQLITINEKINMPNCLILSCDMDKYLLQDLHKYNNSDFQIKILTIDFLLQSILQQEILPIDSFILKI
ncbi:unnamed protein product [Adineta steineri]|uniref:BRCT domain-containing protein n=2 Tax=Adineta steineri TaxID=433720 RepID=A0A813WV78_9BILA|nr:unnamed protein product [Adineta steineri]CAF0861068.1 unnamed protein product [Adineta steineri]